MFHNKPMCPNSTRMSHSKPKCPNLSRMFKSKKKCSVRHATSFKTRILICFNKKRLQWTNKQLFKQFIKHSFIVPPPGPTASSTPLLLYVCILLMSALGYRYELYVIIIIYQEDYLIFIYIQYIKPSSHRNKQI